ncbi:MAG: Holliday junction resolvase RuvX [Firmicutes bacterium]|nr:Holliday junction resolvase RuvX [Bacillota bacterium]
MRILGLDYGQKRVGVAITDPLGITAQGLEVITFTDPQVLLARVGDLCSKYDVEKIVVGLPLRLDGSRGPAAEMAKQFKDLLKKSIGLPVIMVDERLTTRAAEQVLLAGNVRRKKRKGLQDKLAAVLILDTYLRTIETKEGGNADSPANNPKR